MWWTDTHTNIWTSRAAVAAKNINSENSTPTVMISMEWDKLRSSDSFLLMNNFTDSYESVNRAKNRWLNPTDGVIKLCLFSLICTVQVLHLNSNKSFVLNICYVVFLSSGLLRKGLYICVVSECFNLNNNMISVLHDAGLIQWCWFSSQTQSWSPATPVWTLLRHLLQSVHDHHLLWAAAS